MATLQLKTSLVNNKNRLEDFEFISRVKSGSFGEVSKYRDKRDKQVKAIKKIFDRELYAVNEMRMRGDDLMSKLKHDHIAEYYGYFFDDQNHLCFIMKFYQSGNLEDHLKEKKEQNVQLDYMIILKWSLQLLDAIHYTTSRHIIHNDLKPANILLTDDKSSIVITDFGMAIVWDTNRSYASFVGGTPLYLAPEALDNHKVYPKSDLWSCAVIIYELIHFMKPFNFYREVGTKTNIYFCQSSICNKFRPLLQRIFQNKIEDRPEIIDALYYLKHLDDSKESMNVQISKLAISPARNSAAALASSSKNEDDKQLDLITKAALILRDDDTIENQILSFSAHLDCSSIAESLISDFIKFAINPNNANQINEEIVKQKIKELAQKGFVANRKVDEKGRRTFKLDDKIKELVLKQLRILAKKQKVEEKILEYFDEKTPWIAHGNPGDGLEKFKAFYAHLMEIASKIQLENEHKAGILSRIGLFNQAIRNDYNKALEYQKRSLSIRERIHHKNPDHADIAASLHNIGVAYDSLGDFRKAIDYYERSLKINEKTYKNADHPNIAHSLNNIGATYGKLGDNKKELEYFERSLRMLERHYKNADHPSIATLLYNIGMRYNNVGDHKKALDYFERSLRMHQILYESNNSYMNYLQKRIPELKNLNSVTSL